MLCTNCKHLLGLHDEHGCVMLGCWCDMAASPKRAAMQDVPSPAPASPVVSLPRFAAQSSVAH